MSWVQAQELSYTDPLNAEYDNSNKMSFLQTDVLKFFEILGTTSKF
jgi:hypothetical protein